MLAKKKTAGLCHVGTDPAHLSCQMDHNIWLSDLVESLDIVFDREIKLLLSGYKESIFRHTTRVQPATDELS